MRILSRYTFVLITLFLLFPSLKTIALSDVVINEIAWMGTKDSYNNEWIELYNNSNLSKNIDNWNIRTKSGSLKVNLKGIIPPQGFYLLERGNEDTLPKIKADIIYTGYLKNSGEDLILYNDIGKIIDEVDCSLGWFAGNNQTKQTMERINPVLGAKINNWQTSKNSGGTPKSKNSIKKNIEQKKEEEKLITYTGNIVINEVLPSPEGPDSKNEWIELKNLNNKIVNLSYWKIKDIKGSTVVYTFPEKTSIEANGFLVIPRPKSKITLNNDGDGIVLSQPNGNVVDKISYPKTPRNQSYNRTESGYVWSKILTPGAKNIIQEKREIQPIPETKENQDILSQNIQNKKIKQGLGAASVSVGKLFFRKQLSFLVAFLTALFSGTTIFVLKRMLSK